MCVQQISLGIWTYVFYLVLKKKKKLVLTEVLVMCAVSFLFHWAILSPVFCHVGGLS